MRITIHKRLALDLLADLDTGRPLALPEQTIERTARPGELLQLATVATYAAGALEIVALGTSYVAGDRPRRPGFGAAAANLDADILSIVHRVAQAAVVYPGEMVAENASDVLPVELAERLMAYRTTLDRRDAVAPETIGEWTRDELITLAAAALANYVDRTAPDASDPPGADDLAQRVAEVVAAVYGGVGVVSFVAVDRDVRDAFGEIIETDISLDTAGHPQPTPVCGWPDWSKIEAIVAECRKAMNAAEGRIEHARANEMNRN